MTNVCIPIYFQDNSSVHRAHIVSNWLAEQRDVAVLPWPSKACDLNPIENVWGNIVNTWEEGQERNLQNLQDHIRID